jgi:hypothetical protein
MNIKRKKEIRKQFGAYLKKHREDVLRIGSVRQLSFLSNLDQSKLSKLEKGQIDFRFDTLIEIVATYKLKPKNLLGFDIIFLDKEAE